MEWLQDKYDRALKEYETIGDEQLWVSFIATLSEQEKEELYLDENGHVDLFLMFDEDDDLGRSMREDYDKWGIPY